MRWGYPTTFIIPVAEGSTVQRLIEIMPALPMSLSALLITLASLTGLAIFIIGAVQMFNVSREPSPMVMEAITAGRPDGEA
jgi:hypothetical protein